MGNKTCKGWRHRKFELNRYLMEAARKGREECLRWMISVGADVNGLQCVGDTPLTVAVAHGNAECAKILIQAGADVNRMCFTSKEGETPLSKAVRANEPQCVRVLLDVGADVNQENKNHKTALMWAFDYYNRDECIELLLKAGANVDKALVHTAGKGRMPDVIQLLKLGADVNAIGNNGNTALTAAAQCGHYECAKFLIQAGANVNTHTSVGTTPLMYAVGYDGDLVQVLINEGADVNFVSKSSSDKSTPLMKAISTTKDRHIDALIRAGADVNAMNKNRATALLLAAEHDDITSLEVLIRAGAHVNTADNDNNTALIKVAHSQSVECVKLLLQSGAKINIVNKNNRNALRHHCASNFFVNWDKVNVLFAAGEKITGDIHVGKKLENSTQIEQINLAEHFKPKEICLEQICREAIRKRMIQARPHEHLFNRVPRLGLPKSLMQCLLYGISLQ